MCLAIACVCSPVSAAAQQEQVVQPGSDNGQATGADAMPAQPALLTEGAGGSVRSTTDESVLTAEQWERGRSGDTILQLPAVRTVVDDWLSDTGRVIEIRYPGGEEGEFWVHELADWLVALGIPADSLVMSPGSGAGDVISFQLIRTY